MPRAALGVAVKVDDLKEFGRDLKALGDADLTAEFVDANVSAAELIVARARVKAAGEGRQAKAAAKTLRAVKSRVRSEVVLGGTKAPWALGSEFGANQRKPRKRTSGTYQGFNQFKAWRGAGESAGYFLYPTIRASQDEIEEQYLNALDGIVAKAFPTQGA